MKRVLIVIIGFLVTGILGAYMCSYQVRFDQVSVITTFGRAEPGSSKNLDGGGAGLYWKWPWPIQKVRTYDARVRIIEDRLEQQETKDRQVVIVKAYLAWRIVEPLSFFRSLRTATDAQRFLRDRLRAARSEIGNFTFDDLTNANPEKVRLEKLEKDILNRMKRELDEGAYGLEISTVGIKRILLPSQITDAVFERMRQTRRRLAQSAQSEGEALARSIRAKAFSDRERILAFANRKAQEIRAEGDEAAARYYKEFSRDEQFAVFLRKLETLQNVLSRNTTFLLDTKLTPFDLLEEAKGGINGGPVNKAAPESEDHDQ